MRKEIFFAIIGFVLAAATLAVWYFSIAPRYEARDPFAVIFAIVALILGVLSVSVIFGSNTRLNKLNRKLQDLLKENYEVGKILVRRDLELTEANNRLVALDESKSEFVSIAAHQLRTPLTGIRWTFNALLDRELGDLSVQQYKVIDSGLKASIRMIDLVNDLLNVARIEEGRFGLLVKPVSFVKFLKPIVERMERFAAAKGIALSSEISPALPVCDIDEEKLGIALDNVLDNAIKYTPPGGKITLAAVPAPGGIMFTVSDTGIGIPPAQLGRIFNKFFRADNALRYQTSGNGLGLYVVKNIIDSHGGTIKLESQENRGATATVFLPQIKPLPRFTPAAKPAAAQAVKA